MKRMIQRYSLCALLLAAMAVTVPTAVADEHAANEKPESVRVTLIEPGEEPRRELRITASPGDTQRLVLVQQNTMEQLMNGRSRGEQEMPETKMFLNIEVTDVKDNGDIHYRAEYEDIEVSGDNPQLVQMIEHSMQNMVGTKADAVITNRGILRSVSIDADARNPMMAQLLDSMETALEQMSMPFPEEPVGKGAKWKYDLALEMQGMEMQISSDVEIIELREDGYEAKFTMTTSADEQNIDAPGMPPNATMTLTSFDGEGSGNFSHRLRNVMPFGRFTSKMDMHLDIDMMGQQQSMQRRMSIRQESKERADDD